MATKQYEQHDGQAYERYMGTSSGMGSITSSLCSIMVSTDNSGMGSSTMCSNMGMSRRTPYMTQALREVDDAEQLVDDGDDDVGEAAGDHEQHGSGRTHAATDDERVHAATREERAPSRPSLHSVHGGSLYCTRSTTPAIFMAVNTEDSHGGQ
eukprot:126520-Prymnesium_polylepis.2